MSCGPAQPPRLGANDFHALQEAASAAGRWDELLDAFFSAAHKHHGSPRAKVLRSLLSATPPQGWNVDRTTGLAGPCRAAADAYLELGCCAEAGPAPRLFRELGAALHTGASFYAVLSAWAVQPPMVAWSPVGSPSSSLSLSRSPSRSTGRSASGGGLTGSDGRASSAETSRSSVGPLHMPLATTLPSLCCPDEVMTLVCSTEQAGGPCGDHAANQPKRGADTVDVCNLLVKWIRRSTCCGNIATFYCSTCKVPVCPGKCAARHKGHALRRHRSPCPQFLVDEQGHFAIKRYPHMRCAPCSTVYCTQCIDRYLGPLVVENVPPHVRDGDVVSALEDIFDAEVVATLRDAEGHIWIQLSRQLMIPGTQCLKLFRGAMTLLVKPPHVSRRLGDVALRHCAAVTVMDVHPGTPDVSVTACIAATAGIDPADVLYVLSLPKWDHFAMFVEVVDAGVITQLSTVESFDMGGYMFACTIVPVDPNCMPNVPLSAKEIAEEHAGHRDSVMKQPTPALRERAFFHSLVAAMAALETKQQLPDLVEEP